MHPVAHVGRGVSWLSRQCAPATGPIRVNPECDIVKAVTTWPQAGRITKRRTVPGCGHLLDQFGQRLGAEVATGDLPLVMLLGQDGTNEAGDGGVVGEDADDVGAALDLAVEAFDGVVATHHFDARRRSVG